MKNIKPNMILENRLPNSNTVIVVRAIEPLNSFGEYNGMWRVVPVTDDNGASDKQLIARNKTYGCPEENLFYHDQDCLVCHKDGLVWIG